MENKIRLTHINAYLEQFQIAQFNLFLVTEEERLKQKKQKTREQQFRPA